MIKQTLLAAIMAFSVTSANAMTLGEQEYVTTVSSNSRYYMTPIEILPNNTVVALVLRNAVDDKTVDYMHEEVIQYFNCINKTSRVTFMHFIFRHKNEEEGDVSKYTKFTRVKPNTLGNTLLEAACSVLQTY